FQNIYKLNLYNKNIYYLKYSFTELTTYKFNINEININKLRFLNSSIAKIYTIYISNCEASKANSDMIKGLEE
ncbi:hypothetical protein BC938DRAFT_471540, partial [Jimgerdemannia flammicorona]